MGDLKRIGFRVLISGTIRIKYTQTNSGAGNDVYSKIWRNSTLEHSKTTASGDSDDVSEDVAVSFGDVVQIVHWSENALNFSTLSNVRVTAAVDVPAIG